MSINDLHDTVNDLARRAIFQSKAIYTCPAHPEVTLTADDHIAENLAYAIATNYLKNEFGNLELRNEVLAAIKNEIDMADYECTHCQSNLRN